MDLENIIIFGANSHLAKKIIPRLNFKKIICISKNLKIKKKNVIIFSDYYKNQIVINKFLKKNPTIIFFNNNSFDNLILNKSVDELKKELEASLFSVYNDARLICANLIKYKGGSLIFVGSSRGLTSDIGISGYAIGKNALLGLMNSFAIEFSRFAIRSNYLSLGYFKSPLFNKIKNSNKLINKTVLKKVGDYQSIVNAIEFLSSSKYITKSLLRIDGGFN
jgi:NAD(P)-dependent dehydrogenase (short-subunit alcohol dehydrogenase family)